jgi:hypothetical protein
MQIQSKVLASCIVAVSLGSTMSYAQGNAVLYEGASLIIGDASAPIENGAFSSRMDTLQPSARKAPSKRLPERLVPI